MNATPQQIKRLLSVKSENEQWAPSWKNCLYIQTSFAGGIIVSSDKIVLAYTQASLTAVKVHLYFHRHYFYEIILKTWQNTFYNTKIERFKKKLDCFVLIICFLRDSKNLRDRVLS